MQIVCPACHQPIDEDETQQRLDDGTSVSRCSNCGLVLTKDEATSSFLAAPRQPHSRIANFSLVRLLGEGGFGAVWLAEDRSLGRRVALKLPKRSGKDPKLLHEAQTAAKLRHPNIVSIYEVGVDEDQVFIASEYIEGEDLRSELAQGRPTVARAVQLIKTLARAVHHAHRQGVVHRDIKPANVIINSDGEPVIADFGIAKQLAVDETISTDGAVVGTVSYMSPEQARGNTRETDHRSDVYALGVMLFEMLTEYRPFRGNARAVIHQKIHDEPPSPTRLVPSLPKDLETICLKCLEREPGKRYQSASDVAEELERFENGLPIKARPLSRIQKAWRWSRRKPATAALLLGFLLSLTLGLAGTTHFWMAAQRNAEHTRKSLYLAHMNLAAKFWESGDLAGLAGALNNYGTDSRAAGLRDFEWHYFAQVMEPFQQIADHGEVVSDVAASRDGSFFASAGNDRVIRIWDSKTGKLVRSLQPGQTQTGSIEFSPADDRLVSAHRDGIVRLWNPRQHDHPASRFEHGPGLTHARFSDDGRFLVSAGRNGVIRLWKVASAEQFAEHVLPGQTAQDVRFSPDGSLIAVATQDGKVLLWDTQTNSDVHHLQTNSQLLCIAFADEGRSLVAGSYGSTVQYWSVETGARLESLYVAGGAIGDLEFLEAAQLLAVVTTAHRLHLFDNQGHEVRSLATHTLTHGMLAQSHDGRFLVAGSGDGSVKLLSVDSLRRRDVFWHDAHVRDVQVLRDGRLAACTGDGSLQVWNCDTGQLQTLVAPSGKELLAVAAQPGGNLLAACGMDRELLLVDLERPESAESIPLPYGGFSTVCFSADGSLLATGSRSGAVRVYDMQRLDEPGFEMAEADVQINDLCFSPGDSDHLAVARSDGRVFFADAAKGQVVGRHVQLTASPLALVFCEDGSQLAVATQAGNIHFLDCPTLSEARVIKAHSGRINALAVLPGGTRLVSGGRDKDLRVWDWASGALITTLSGHGRQVFAISAAHDASVIASAGLEGDVRVWRGKPGPVN